jgi:hypothetical protein
MDSHNVGEWKIDRISEKEKEKQPVSLFTHPAIDARGYLSSQVRVTC